jgi:hypothetical protein
MPEMGTSGLMSGDGKRGGAVAPVLAPILDSTGILRRTSARMPTLQPERSLHGCSTMTGRELIASSPQKNSLDTTTEIILFSIEYETFPLVPALRALLLPPTVVLGCSCKAINR